MRVENLYKLSMIVLQEFLCYYYCLYLLQVWLSPLTLELTIPSVVHDMLAPWHTHDKITFIHPKLHIAMSRIYCRVESSWIFSQQRFNKLNLCVKRFDDWNLELSILCTGKNNYITKCTCSNMINYDYSQRMQLDQVWSIWSVTNCDQLWATQMQAKWIKLDLGCHEHIITVSWIRINQKWCELHTGGILLQCKDDDSFHIHIGFLHTAQR